jgi:DNA-binding protein HU-beta
MNKAELVEYMAQAADLQKKQAEKALLAFWEAMTITLQKGETLTLSGYGNFGVKQRLARTGVNPRTKKPIEIAAATRIYFKAGHKLKAAVNDKN